MLALLDRCVVRAVDSNLVGEPLLAQVRQLKSQGLDVLSERLQKQFIHTAKSRYLCKNSNGIYTVGI